MDSSLYGSILFYFGRDNALELPQVRDTSVSDLWLIWLLALYAGYLLAV